MVNRERFILLLQLFREDRISIAEQDELFGMIASHSYDQLLGEQIAEDLQKKENTAPGLPPHISQEVMRNILSAERLTANMIPARRTFRLKYWSAAAAVLIVAVISFFMFKPKNDSKSFASVIPQDISTVNNPGDSIRTVVLADGSKITLQPHSTLYFPGKFSDSLREVYFEGKAFFEIARNPQKPFLVYSNRIVTKVLGTSFYINTLTPDGNEEVSVRTGKVQVFENLKVLEKSRYTPSIIITPNQRAIYEPDKRLFETTLVEKPQPLIDEGHDKLPVQIEIPNKCIYEQEKLQSIFKQLEERYGIEIVAENPDLVNCEFTGDLSDEDLFTKLKILCLATRSSYEINGTKILIKGNGCQ